LLRINRYLTHAVVLVIAVVISGYSSIDHQFNSYLRLGAVNAQALVIDQGGSVGDVSFGRYSTIIAPVEIPTSAPKSHIPSTYTVGVNDSLSSIAAKFNVTVNELRWSNPGLYTDPTIMPGMQITIPPTPGVVVTVKAGQTLQSLAAAYKADAQLIADYNRLRVSQLSAGMVLVIPNGVGPAFPAPPPPPVLYTNFRITIGAPVGTYPATGFPWGWCTWYVATRRPVPWRGNAIEWYGNAAAMGYPVGSQPRVGAIMVTTESPIGLGHVAYVEAVYADGSWLVSEMHYVAFGVTDERLIKPGQLNGALIGFIYG
jgi:LysM repeat protein